MKESHQSVSSECRKAGPDTTGWPRRRGRGPGLVGAETGPGSLEPASGGRRLRGAKVCGDSAGVARETPQGQAPFNSDVGGCLAMSRAARFLRPSTAAFRGPRSTPGSTAVAFVAGSGSASSVQSCRLRSRPHLPGPSSASPPRLKSQAPWSLDPSPGPDYPLHPLVPPPAGRSPDQVVAPCPPPPLFLPLTED